MLKAKSQCEAEEQKARCQNKVRIGTDKGQACKSLKEPLCSNMRLIQSRRDSGHDAAVFSPPRPKAEQVIRKSIMWSCVLDRKVFSHSITLQNLGVIGHSILEVLLCLNSPTFSERGPKAGLRPIPIGKASRTGPRSDIECALQTVFVGTLASWRRQEMRAASEWCSCSLKIVAVASDLQPARLKH